MLYRSGQGAGLEVVGVGWVEACVRAGSRVEAAGYVVKEAGGKDSSEGQRRGLPPRLQLEDDGGQTSRKRRRVARKGSKAMTPRAVETLEVDADRLDSARRMKRGGGFREDSGVEGRKKAGAVRDEEEGDDAGVDGVHDDVDGVHDDVDGVHDDVDDVDELDRSLVERVARRVSADGTGAAKRGGLNEDGSLKEKAIEKNKKATNKKSIKQKKKKKPSQANKGQPAVRFSTRCLRQYPSRPVRLDKTLPEGPVETKKILKQTVGGHAPIPEIKRVESPWGTPQTTSRLPVGVIGNLDLRTVSKANVRDATASTRKLIKEVPSPWSVVRVYDNIPVEREVQPNSVHSARRRSLLGVPAGSAGGAQTRTPMSSQALRVSRAQVQSLRMSIQRHESTMHHGSQNMSPNPSPLVLSGCPRKNPAGLSIPGPSSQAPPMFAEVVTQNSQGTMGDLDADGDINDEYGTEITAQAGDASTQSFAQPSESPTGVVAGAGGAGSVDGSNAPPTADAANEVSNGPSIKFSTDPTIYYTAQDAATQGTSQQMTQLLHGTSIGQLQSMQSVQPMASQPQVSRLSQEMLTLPTPSQASEANDDDRTPAQASQLQATETMRTTQDLSTEQPTQTPVIKSGTIAFTSLSQETLTSCKEATSILPGLTLWSSTSRKSSAITHLIIGDNRRTLKVMLAVMRGAYLLTPTYVTDSVAAGYWLPEDAYLADVVFQSGALKARQFLSGSSDAPYLLKGKKVAIYNGKRTMASSDTYGVVRRICQELGGTLFHISEADIVIIMNDEESRRPSGLKDTAITVQREWLFQSACEYELLDTAEFRHVFGKIRT